MDKQDLLSVICGREDWLSAMEIWAEYVEKKGRVEPEQIEHLLGELLETGQIAVKDISGRNYYRAV